MIEIYTAGMTPAQSPTAKAKTQAAGAGGTDFAKALASVQNKGRNLDPYFKEASETYGVPQELLRSIAFHESGFLPDAVSRCGAMGLMQLMPDTAKAMGVADPYDPQQNIMGGAKLLGQYLKQYDGDLKLTLAAYGAGSGSVEKYGGVPPYAETQKFVEDILSVTDSHKLSLEEPAFAEYPELYGQITDFSGYTQRDYQVFVSYLLQSMALGLSADALEKQAAPLFYLGR